MKPKYIDIHAHMNFSEFQEDRDQIIKNALENGIHMINVGTNSETSQEVVRLANKYDSGVYAIVGLHPIYVDGFENDEESKSVSDSRKHENFDPKIYKELLQNPKVVGIGECGLDYFHISGESKEFKKHQEEAFRQQIELAIEYDKPLMIHCRDAYDDVLRILQEYKGKVRGNIHFFAGTKEEAKSFINLGFTVSFTGVITFVNSYDEVVKSIPLESMHAETDCPYVAPVSHRGKRNQCSYVTEIVARIAEIRGESEEKVRETLLQNAHRVFGVEV